MPLFGSKKKSEIPPLDSGPPPSSSSSAGRSNTSNTSSDYRPGYGSSQPPPARVNFSNRYANNAPPPPQQQQYGQHQQQPYGGGYNQGPPPPQQQHYGRQAPPQGYPSQQQGPGPQAPSSRGALFSSGGRQNSGSGANSAYAGTVPQNDGGSGAGSYAAGGGAGAGAARQQSGYAASSAPSYQTQDAGNNAYGGGQQGQEANEEDDEIEGIRHMVKQTNQQSLASTRNALRTAREAEETARATVEKLNEQTERFAATEQSLDIAKNYASRTEDNTKEIKALNRSIFRPNVTFNKQAKRDAADARILSRHLAEKEERDQMLRDADRARSIGDAALGRRPGYGPQAEEVKGREGRRDYAARSKYTFEADEEDHAVEDEIEDNIDEMTRLAMSLNGLATAQGNILGEHNRKLDGLNDKADALDIKLVKGTQKMKHL